MHIGSLKKAILVQELETHIGHGKSIFPHTGNQDKIIFYKNTQIIIAYVLFLLKE